MMMNTAYILIPALPFAAFLIIALGSRWVGEASHRLAIPAVSASFILSVLACIDVYQNGARSIPLYTLITSGRLIVEAGLYVDAVTVVLLFLVTGVSSLVHVFSSRYMQADPRYARFFALIALFTSAMVMLVMGANLFMLFMFWEIMGLCSYLLISHWSRRPSACDAATKAFLVNGVADIGLAFGIYLTWATFGTLDIQAILSAAPQYADQTVNLLGWLGLEWQAPILSVIALLLFMGPIGKSAQIPLHVWLPFAMEAPTPVSALIHAATMVNAGVYLLIRMGPLYVLAPTIMTVVAIIGGVTALFAAAVALTAFDIKRILAYSTISQLGFMVLACGVGAYGAAIFHLLTHGAMKSFLFLSAGSALHNLGGTHHGEHDGDHAEHGHPSRTRVSRQQVPLYVGALCHGVDSTDHHFLGALRTVVGHVAPRPGTRCLLDLGAGNRVFHCVLFVPGDHGDLHANRSCRLVPGISTGDDAAATVFGIAAPGTHSHHGRTRRAPTSDLERLSHIHLSGTPRGSRCSGKDFARGLVPCEPSSWHRRRDSRLGHGVLFSYLSGPSLGMVVRAQKNLLRVPFEQRVLR